MDTWTLKTLSNLFSKPPLWSHSPAQHPGSQALQVHQTRPSVKGMQVITIIHISVGLDKKSRGKHQWSILNNYIFVTAHHSRRNPNIDTDFWKLLTSVTNVCMRDLQEEIMSEKSMRNILLYLNKLHCGPMWHGQLRQRRGEKSAKRHKQKSER